MFKFFQGVYLSVFVDPLFPMKFFVVGSLQHFNHGVFEGKGFVCSNPHHEQSPGFDQCSVTKPRGFATKLKKMRASKALQVGLCRSQHGYLCVPESDIIRLPSADVTRLNVFAIVLKEWVDFENRLVIIPSKMHIKIGESVQYSYPAKSVLDINEEDHQYFRSCRTDLLANRHQWIEYCFNSCVGPIMTLAEAISTCKIMNKTFIDDMRTFKLRMRNAPSQ
jgi:hypothetical protein